MIMPSVIIMVLPERSGIYSGDEGIAKEPTEEDTVARDEGENKTFIM
jgi:hypothetical protein